MQAMHIDELQQKNAELIQLLRQERDEKNKVLAAKEETSQESARREIQLQELLKAAEERDAAMMKLEARSRLFYEVAEHKFALTRILEVLDEVSDIKCGFHS